jgi:hypothetical protein
VLWEQHFRRNSVTNHRQHDWVENQGQLEWGEEVSLGRVQVAWVP